MLKLYDINVKKLNSLKRLVRTTVAMSQLKQQKSKRKSDITYQHIAIESMCQQVISPFLFDFCCFSCDIAKTAKKVVLNC